MANAGVPEGIDRATVDKYCEEYCKNNIDMQCWEIIQEDKNEERRRIEELSIYLEGVMLGIGLYWLYTKSRWFC